MNIRQISIYIENKPGHLSAICRALSDAGINITTLSLADTSDFGIVRLIVDDNDRARVVLAAKGFPVSIREVVAVCVPDRPGGMAEVMSTLDAAGVNVEYSYAFAFHRGEKAVLVFRFDDAEKAQGALVAAGYTILAEHELEEEAK